MKKQPGHIDELELARTLHGHWGLVPARLRHLPAGFGDYHRELTDAAGGRWFVTVADLAGRQALAPLGQRRHAPLPAALEPG